MLNIAAVAGLAVVLALSAFPAGAGEEVTIEQRKNDSSVSGAIIMKDRETTGSAGRDCVKTETKSVDKTTGDEEVRVEKSCD